MRIYTGLRKKIIMSLEPIKKQQIAKLYVFEKKKVPKLDNVNQILPASSVALGANI